MNINELGKRAGVIGICILIISGIVNRIRINKQLKELKKIDDILDRRFSEKKHDEYEKEA